jgi:hypothetical protein
MEYWKVGFVKQPIEISHNAHAATFLPLFHFSGIPLFHTGEKNLVAQSDMHSICYKNPETFVIFTPTRE